MTESSIDNRPYITSSGRDLRLDFLRGYFVLIMIIDHIAGPSPLYWFTGGGNKFFISGAEGFFLISGLVTGIVYHRIVECKGFLAAIKKMLHRVIILYLVSTSINLISLLGLNTFWDAEKPQPQQFFRIFSLQAGGVITAYVFLYLLAPFALMLLTKGKGKYLLTFTWLWYILYVIFPQYVAFPFDTFTNISGLQVIFFTAMYVGFQNHNSLNYGKNLINKNRLILFGGAFLVLIIFYIFLHPPSWMPQISIPNETIKWLNLHIFNKPSLRPGRLIAGIVVYGSFFIFLSLYWKQTYRAIGRLIMPFGISALYAFSLHTPFVIISDVLMTNGQNSLNFITNMLPQVAIVIVVWFLTKKQVLAPTKQNLHFWYLFPFVLGLILFLIDYVIHTFPLIPYILRALVYWITWFPPGPAGI